MTFTLDRGILIAIEGIDGAGKTTQAELLERALSAVGFTVVRTKEPTAGTYGQRLRDSATAGRLSIDDELELFLADRREHVAGLIEPALSSGKVVIVDRYYFSMAAYQGARGMDPEAILAVNETFAPEPDLLVFLHIPPSAALGRIAVRGGGVNTFEQQSTLEACAAIFEGIRRPYMLRLPGEWPREMIHEGVMRALDEGPVFRRICRKPQLSACEPVLCEVRMQGACRYPDLGGGFYRQASSLPVDEVNRIVQGPGSVEERMERIVEALSAPRK